jgi:hypothetical protein
MLNKLLLFSFILYSCSSVGPNYNQGGSHNADMLMRNKIVFKEDLRIKNKMIKTRTSASKHITRSKNYKKRYNKVRKYI